MKLGRFAIYAWALLAYNLLVILWGAFVRASQGGEASWVELTGQLDQPAIRYCGLLGKSPVLRDQNYSMRTYQCL